MKSTLISAKCFQTLAFAALTTLLCSCAATSVKSTWKSPDYHGKRVSNLATLAVDERPLLREGFENRLVGQLQKGGATAFTTVKLLGLDEISHDKAAAAERFRSAGAEGLVMVRLVDATTYYREFRSGPEVYAQTINGFETYGWYNYYSVAYTDMSVTYGSEKTKVYLETVLFDLKTGKRLWSGLTETTFTEGMDRLAEMDRIVEKAVTAMRTDGMVP
jgi:hypothetical protein